MSNDERDRDTVRTMWALGDYHRFATELVWEVGEVVAQASGAAPGKRVLDVAAGSGNVALRAARAGAEVVALDLTPENFEPGRQLAQELGVKVTWIEGDAQALPFDDDSFDVVTSCFGALFAPHHQRVADEMLRVCRPGGTIALASFTPETVGGAFFELFGRYAPPPPPGAEPPVEWGREEHLRKLFGERIDGLETTRRTYLERAPSPEAYHRFFGETFGPVIALRASLAEDTERTAAFDRDFLDFANRWNQGPPSGPAVYEYAYLLAVARKRR